MQVDESDTCSNPPVPTSVIWNWKENINRGYEKFAGMITIARTARLSIERAVNANKDPDLPVETTNNTMHPYVAPPSNFVISNSAGSTISLTSADADLVCAIQLFNGKSVQQYGLNRFGGWDRQKYCMKYDKNTGSWEFKPNGNSYVYEVFDGYHHWNGVYPL